MAVFISLLAVFALGFAAYLGATNGLQDVFGTYVPYAAVVIFIVAFVYKMVDWARSPVPFSIPTTGGQMKSMDWVSHNPVDNPHNKGWTVVRMLLEVLTFRSLFRNTKVQLTGDADTPRVAYPSSKWLWLFALMFHYAFLTIFIRHFRFFLEPVPLFITVIEFLDGIMQVGVPRLFQTDIVIIAALLFLIGRRLFDDKIRYISLMNDYFPLFLILGICSTGIWMRYIGKADIAGIKEVTMGLVTLSPLGADALQGVAPIFFIHLFLVCCLLIYFPFSKLMHLGGVFLSPTRNLPNDSRAKHYDNPWNPPKKFHTYAEYEDEFRDAMFDAGLPLEKLPDSASAEEE